ncbi:unnamed protein product [Trichogramma brassicae]|uniref:Uncharacterized protein n=1 Tax=Trichogramma brassicae TaxID=86971 RepID=A0A6H5IV23_9HYME|nr:unnamed protein product [Trichogramma brassicae]
MVVFTCNHCGDSLQKPKVAKHYQFACRKGIFLTCVDCHKDFYEDEYTAHTKCITENQRYGGKDYVEKPSCNKGERKQQAWLEIVQNVLTNTPNLSGPERNFLNSISKHENLPRKKPKFLNFIRSAFGNRFNMAVVDSTWTKMENAFKEATAEKTVTSQQNNGAQIREDKQDKVENSKDKDNKKEKKENKILATENDNTELPQISNEVESENVNEVEKESKKKNKSKKRVLEDNDNENSEPLKKKKLEKEAENISVNENNKFSWKNSILEILTAKGEITKKKLKKKVIALYLEQFPDATSESADSKFEKKLCKVSGVLIADKKVTLTKV